MNPPRNVQPSELWQKLSERPRPTSAPIDFPVKSGTKSPGQVVLRVLTESETHYCRAAADKVAKGFLGGDAKPGDLGYDDIYRNEFAVELLMLACRHPQHPEMGIFPSAEAARGKMTEDEIAALVQAYNLFRMDSGPLLSELTVPEMEAWIKVLREGAQRAPLARLSGEALSDLVMYLVSQTGSSPTGSGSAGSPPAGSSTEPVPPPASELVGGAELDPTAPQDVKE